MITKNNLKKNKVLNGHIVKIQTYYDVLQSISNKEIQREE